MPNIIDSLFLELGIDTSKFSRDQQQALAKIAEFEKRAKKSGKGAADSIKTVGEAFRDLANESRIGASAAGVERLASKLTMLGKSAQVAGVAGGAAAEGLGMLLTPTALGIAAIGLLGAEMWDFNKQMTATNATIYRQAQLSGMAAANLWDWGEAAKTVGANPQEVTGGIAALQTSIMGMGIGAANATPQLVALARLGVPFNFRTGADIPSLVARVHEMASASGFENLGALRALTGPVMSDALFNIATNRAYDPSTLKQQIKTGEAVNTGDILRKSLESQAVLGKLGISKDVLAMTTYGGIQGLMQAMVELLTGILGGINHLVEFFTGVITSVPEAVSRVPDTLNDFASSAWNTIKGTVSQSGHRAAEGAQFLMSLGASKEEAESIIGNVMQESSMDPFARNGSYAGYGQWEPARQANFKKRFGYLPGDKSVGGYKQSLDQLQFLWDELHTADYQKALTGMQQAKDLFGKTKAFMKFDEKPGDGSLGARFANAQAVARMLDAAGASSRTNITVSNDTTINGGVNVHTPSTDPAAHADAVVKGITTHPLFSLAAAGAVSLSTRGMAQ